MQRESIRAWEKLPFHPLSPRSSFEKYLQTVPVQGIDLLGATAQEELRVAIQSLTDAYRHGSFDAFMRFRLPEGSEWVENPSQINIIRDNWKRAHPRANPPAAGVELYKWWVENKSGGTFYKDFWQEVSLTPSEVYKQLGGSNYGGYPAKVGIYVTNLPIHMLSAGPSFGEDAVVSMFHAGLQEFPATFLYKPSTNTIESSGVASKAGILAADVYLFVKRHSPDAVFPVALRYVWDDKSKQWVPTDFVVGVLPGQAGFSFVF